MITNILFSVSIIIISLICWKGFDYILEALEDIKINQKRIDIKLNEIQKNKELKEYNESQLAYDLENIKEDLTKTIKDESNRTIHTIACTPLKVTQIK